MTALPTALITGATSGIGLALARRLAATHRLVLSGRREPQKLPDKASYVGADLSEPGKAADVVHMALREAGITKLSKLVLNAGTGTYAAADAEDAGTIRHTLDVNLVASVLMAHRLAPLLEAGSGKLVLIGSVAHRGSGNMPSYAASKAGLSGLARSLRSEWNGRIGVQIIHPGPTRTPMHENAGYQPGGLDRLFFSADAMADEIARLIEADRPATTIMIAARLRRLVSGKRS
ncbi:SDR family NAD(P)-dependent oxidoreductase [Hoeflea sp.]|uniref:SDR family NAD(P)-dependent oxidoreductase n=1 Tax=Hoeflea sp. TaxID=1940281 RepID=UPI003B011F50